VRLVYSNVSVGQFSYPSNGKLVKEIDAKVKELDLVVKEIVTKTYVN